jgi:hypothetical protein
MKKQTALSSSQASSRRPKRLPVFSTKDWQLIVVGDRKTPTDWHHEQTKFLSVSDQESSGYNIAALLPWNHYCRKMVGYVEAIKSGAEVIVDTDDDNIAKANWQIPDFSGEYALTKAGRASSISIEVSRINISGREAFRCGESQMTKRLCETKI